MAGSKRQKNRKIQRDYVLHDPQLRYLLGTLENYGHHMDEERYTRVESQVNEQKEKVREKAFNKNLPDPFEEPTYKDFITRPKSAVSAQRDYILHEPRFRDLQENYLKYYNRPTTADQTKDDLRRKKRLSAAVRDKKKELLEMRMGTIDELKENLEELEEMDVEDMNEQELIEHKQRISNLRARIEREMKNIRFDFLPKLVSHPKPYKPQPVLIWNNPPQYDKSAPHLRQVTEVNDIYGAHMDATRKAILDSTVEHILANKKEYAAWKRQIRQNVEEKLRNEGVQPVKLRQRPEMTMMWERKSLPHVTRAYGERPEYELEEPSFRYLANTEENFLHLRQVEAKKCFCNRFLKAKEIELRKQRKRAQRIERARQALLQKQKKEPEKILQPTPSLHWHISRDYVKHEPLFRYIENVKLNFYDHLTPKQKKQFDKKYQEMKRQNELKLKNKEARRDRYCQKYPSKCPAPPKEPVPDPLLTWTPRTDYDRCEPPFRFYEDIKNQYLHVLSKKRKKHFLTKYKQAKAIEDAKRKKRQEREEKQAQEKAKSEKESKEKEELPPVTPRTGYDINAPGFRYVQNTAENYESYLGKISKEPFMQKYETMKAAEKERLEKLEKRQEMAYQKHLEKHPATPDLPSKKQEIETQRDYELSDPRFVHLYDTWMRYKDQIPKKRKDYGENLLKKLSEKAETSKLTHAKRCEHAYNIRYPDQGDQLQDINSATHPTQAEREDRIRRLATPNRRLLEDSYEKYKDLMIQEKSERIKMTIDKMRPMSMEQMEEEVRRQNLRKKRLRERANYRNKHKSEFMSRLEDETYKKLVIRLLHKTLRQLPHKVLCNAHHHSQLSNNQQKIYNTALTNFKQIPAIPTTQHLHGLTMQIVQFFDKLLK